MVAVEPERLWETDLFSVLEGAEFIIRPGATTSESAVVVVVVAVASDSSTWRRMYAAGASITRKLLTATLCAVLQPEKMLPTKNARKVKNLICLFISRKCFATDTTIDCITPVIKRTTIFSALRKRRLLRQTGLQKMRCALVSTDDSPPSRAALPSGTLSVFPPSHWYNLPRARLISFFMNTELLRIASDIIPSPQMLVNVISRRVRQLSHGHRPLVQFPPGMGLCDIALSEVGQKKLTFESTPGDDSKVEPAPIALFPSVDARKKAA